MELQKTPTIKLRLNIFCIEANVYSKENQIYLKLLTIHKKLKTEVFKNDKNSLALNP